MELKGFKIGDMVKLRSGGPVMTVSRLVTEPQWQWQEPSVECKWFLQNALQTESFDPTIIDPVE
jgi:uncharacterized protein YodC (DUF2158 family)